MVTMIVLAPGSDILMSRQCSITIVYISASMDVWKQSYVFTNKTEHLFINNMIGFYLQVQEYTFQLSIDLEVG